MKRLLTISFLLFSLNTYSQSKEVIIRGKVIDKITSEALIGVNIICNNQGTSTNIDGFYEIKIPTGESKITFKYIGYENQIKNISYKKDTSINLNISLSPSSEQLNTVVVSA